KSMERILKDNDILIKQEQEANGNALAAGLLSWTSIIQPVLAVVDEPLRQMASKLKIKDWSRLMESLEVKDYATLRAEHDQYVANDKKRRPELASARYLDAQRLRLAIMKVYYLVPDEEIAFQQQALDTLATTVRLEK